MVSHTLDSRETAQEIAATPSPAGAGAIAHSGAGSAAIDPYARKTRRAYDTLSSSSIGLEMGLSVIIGMFFGRWLDGHAGTTPWLTILFLCMGFASGIRAVMRAMAKADRDAARGEIENR